MNNMKTNSLARHCWAGLFLTAAFFAANRGNNLSAAPVVVETDVPNILPLTVDLDGKLVVSATKKLATLPEIQRYLKDQFDFFKRDSGEQAAKDMAVVVRGDNRTNFEHIYRVMRAAKEAGFTNVQLRANRNQPKENDKQPMRKAVSPEEHALPRPDEPIEFCLRINVVGADGKKDGTIESMSWRKKGNKVETAEPIKRIDPGKQDEKDEQFKNLDEQMYGLVVKLKQHQSKEGDKQPTIKIECPRELKYTELVRVMDLMKKMKFQNVGVVQIPKG
jgi:biopolymer transport protein ExbD